METSRVTGLGLRQPSRIATARRSHCAPRRGVWGGSGCAFRPCHSAQRRLGAERRAPCSPVARFSLPLAPVRLDLTLYDQRGLERLRMRRDCRANGTAATVDNCFLAPGFLITFPEFRKTWKWTLWCRAQTARSSPAAMGLFEEGMLAIEEQQRPCSFAWFWTSVRKTH